MSGHDEAAPQVPGQDNDGAGYERSKIQFPYFDLATCINLCSAISEHVGNGECTDDQLAPWIGLSPKSSGYRSRISAARLFGLIEAGPNQDHRLSDLGLKVLDEGHMRPAKAQAFLNVPLFRKVFEDWRGQQLPPAAAMERRFVDFGVAPKQTARARQILERSATEAGYFESGRDKLVKPAVKGVPDPGGQVIPPEKNGPGNRGSGGSGGNGGGGGGKSGLDPIIQGLIDKLPAPGSEWSHAKRKQWLQVMEISFDLVYEEEPQQRERSGRTDSGASGGGQNGG